MKKENKDKIPYSKICRPFEEARAFVHALGIKNVEQWLEYCKSGQKPNDIPHKPERIYKNKGWKSYGDWFGVWKAGAAKKKAKPEDGGKNEKYLPFEEAKKFVSILEIRNIKEWYKYCDSGKRPKNIPYNPGRIYKNSGWKSYADWLGTSRTPEGGKYKTFEDARKFVRKLGLAGTRDWNEYCKSGNKPDYIPFAPYAVYADEGWVSMQDWLGAGKSAEPCAKQKKMSPGSEKLPFAKFRK